MAEDWQLLVSALKSSVFLSCNRRFVTITFEVVCLSIRNVKFINESFYNMRRLAVFITAVCLLFLLSS